ncbi:MAG: hypothetical protein ACRDQ6_23750 [Pseudonocardiaceae bacterium]
MPLVDTAGVDHDGAVALLEAILADLSRLDGAACVGQHHLYDVIDLPWRGHLTFFDQRGVVVGGSGGASPRCAHSTALLSHRFASL